MEVNECVGRLRDKGLSDRVKGRRRRRREGGDACARVKPAGEQMK